MTTPRGVDAGRATVPPVNRKSSSARRMVQEADWVNPRHPPTASKVPRWEMVQVSTQGKPRVRPPLAPGRIARVELQADGVVLERIVGAALLPKHIPKDLVGIGVAAGVPQRAFR